VKLLVKKKFKAHVLQYVIDEQVTHEAGHDKHWLVESLYVPSRHDEEHF